jgi:hypothetical protein
MMPNRLNYLCHLRGESISIENGRKSPSLAKRLSRLGRVVQIAAVYTFNFSAVGLKKRYGASCV